MERDMKKIILIIFILLGATACTNTAEYRKNLDVSNTYTSNKSVEEVSECILVEWQKERLGWARHANLQKTGIYHIVYSEQFIDVCDTFEDNGITRVNFYSYRGDYDFWQGKQKRTKAIERCL